LRWRRASWGQTWPSDWSGSPFRTLPRCECDRIQRNRPMS